MQLFEDRGGASPSRERGMSGVVAALVEADRCGHSSCYWFLCGSPVGVFPRAGVERCLVRWSTAVGVGGGVVAEAALAAFSFHSHTFHSHT